MSSDKNKWVSGDMTGLRVLAGDLFTVGSSVIINHNDGQSVSLPSYIQIRPSQPQQLWQAD